MIPLAKASTGDGSGIILRKIPIVPKITMEETIAAADCFVL